MSSSNKGTGGSSEPAGKASAANTDSKATLIVAGPRLNLPVGYDVVVVRYGKRLKPSTGAPETLFAVLLYRDSDKSTLIVAFVPGSAAPVFTPIQRVGKDRFTDIHLVDFMGNNNCLIVGISGKSEDQPDIVPAFEVFDPATGQPKPIFDTLLQANVARRPIEFTATYDPPPSDKPRCKENPKCSKDMKTDVDGAFITKVNGRDLIAVVPQTSFIPCCFSSKINTYIYFIFYDQKAAAVRSQPVPANHVNANPLERNMCAFVDLGAAGAPNKKFVAMSKSLVFIYDLDPPRFNSVREFSDPSGKPTDFSNSRDVPDYPNVNTCDPDADAKKQCTVQGRRYGLVRPFRINGLTRLVVAACGVPGGPPPDGLVPLYTAYGNPLTETAPGRDPFFLAPIDQWAGATPNPGVGNTHPYRTHYRYFPKAKRKLGQPLTRFANGKPLLRGTPAFGIDFLGDKTPMGGAPVPSILVSSSDNVPGTTRDPVTGGLLPRPSNTGFEVLRADKGVTRFVKANGFTQPGAIAFDLIQATDTTQPARILAWGDLDNKTTYQQGRFQVYLLNQQAGQVALVPGMNLDEEPVLLDFGSLNRTPEDVGAGGNEVSLFNAVIKSNNRRAMLTFPRTNPDGSRDLYVSAYDVDDFTKRLTSVFLEGRLAAVAEPGALPLDAAGTANGSTLIIVHEETSPLGTARSIIFKGVASDTSWRLAKGSLLPGS
ncbi:MAG: hypothetical protein JOZ02_03995 [Acidobacteria bacterium]|nr:hypothetical protein [Acidobacteriota bacterium]